MVGGIWLDHGELEGREEGAATNWGLLPGLGCGGWVGKESETAQTLESAWVFPALEPFLGRPSIIY